MTGWQQSFLHVRSGRCSNTLRALYPECSAEERELSAEYFGRYLSGQGIGNLTLLAGIRRAPGPLAAIASLDGDGPDENASLQAGLSAALSKALPNSRPVDVAVSGGIDSWLLAALLQSQGYEVRGWYLESGVPGYCERQQVECFSKALGIACRHIRVTAADFVEAVPEFVSLVETPIYNLHPVSKWLLAKALCREGVSTLVTGDGADQVMRLERECDLLPLTLTCFRAAGIRVVAPFLEESVTRQCRQPDAGKRPVRELAARLGVPAVPKHATMFPHVPLPCEPPAGLPEGALANTHFDEYAISCLAYTTGLLLQTLEAQTPCAESRG